MINGQINVKKWLYETESATIDLRIALNDEKLKLCILIFYISFPEIIGSRFPCKKLLISKLVICFVALYSNQYFDIEIFD